MPHQMLARMHALPFVVGKPFVRQTEVRRQGNADKTARRFRVESLQGRFGIADIGLISVFSSARLGSGKTIFWWVC